MQIVLRAATLDDVPKLTELMRVTFADTFRHYPPEELATFLATEYSDERTRRALSLTTRRTWVLEDLNRELVGYAMAGEADLPHPEITPRSGQIHRLYVLPAAHGTGLGRRLMDASLAWLEEVGRSPLFIGVWEHNHRALAFYGRYGFTPVGEYAYPVGQTIDRELILRREVASSAFHTVDR